MWAEITRTIKRGGRRCPKSFKDRLDAAFPRVELDLWWDGEFNCWWVMQKGRHSNEWLPLCEWYYEPSGELIAALQAGLIGGRGMPNPKEAADQMISRNKSRKAKVWENWYEDLQTRAKAAEYYLAAAVDPSMYPLHPRYLRKGRDLRKRAA